jgi:hypothetical protein
MHRCDVGGFDVRDATALEGGRQHAADDAKAIYTDDWHCYKGIGDHNTIHDTVNHSAKEYVRGDVHTNTIEGYFSILKRGINGIYHHVSEAHLPRYLAEFDFRYNTRSANGYTDADRTRLALSMVEGKRLRYAE